MNYSDLLKKYEIIQSLIDKLGNEELCVLSKFLKSRIAKPESFVTMLGETSSGKSTLINGYIGNTELKTSSAPTTGTIVEVMMDHEIKSSQYFAINRNATMEKIDKALFDRLSVSPDANLSRLRVVVPCEGAISGMRLFDTPGYGSIIDKHEEVLREFIPNSDVIIYVIGYKIGIQENDFVFMRCIQELISFDTEIVIVVNRCPSAMEENDKRIREIKKYSSDLFHKQVPIFTVQSDVNISENGVVKATDLWEHMEKILNNPIRKDVLINTLDKYLNDLLNQAEAIVDKYEIDEKISIEEKNELRRLADELRAKVHNVIKTEIEPTFDKIINNIPDKLSKSRDIVCDELSNDIDNEKIAKMDEMIVYVNHHLLPMTIERETRQLERYLQLELEAMNERVDDYLNEVIADYYRAVELRFSSNAELAARLGIGKIAGKYMKNGLRQYFAAFGGAGGAGAGVANAAKHLLKKTGDLFGKKFSRETYNALAHTLKKIGFTSVKAIGNVITVVIEVAQVIIDYTTWKPKLKKQVRKGMDTWYVDTCETVKTDIQNLKEQNIRTLTEIIEENATAYELDARAKNNDVSELIELRNEVQAKLKEANLI